MRIVLTVCLLAGCAVGPLVAMSGASLPRTASQGAGSNADAHRLKTGHFVYRDLDHGREMGGGETLIRAAAESGQFTFSTQFTGQFAQRWESICTRRFEPISARLSFGEGAAEKPAFELSYRAGRVTGKVWPRDAGAGDMRPVEALVPADTVDQRIDWAAVLAAELSPGREFEFHVYDPGTGVSQVKARVGNLERVQVPAGTFEVYPVSYAIEKAKGTESYTVYATKRIPRVMVREDFREGLVSELVRMVE